MSILYACQHLEPEIDLQTQTDTTRIKAPPPLPPSYPSSRSSFHPLSSLYFCEECDAVRCDLCVGVEVASYFCPNCLFDVPSANVRADKNRCARSCFSCPQCSSSLAIQASDPPSKSSDLSSSASAPAPGPPYLLTCPGCKWSSKQVGWEFDKSTGIALQLQRIHTQAESVQAEFDALKDHLEAFIASSAPAPVMAPRSARAPSRHISHVTQMAAKALHRDLPGMAASSAKSKSRVGGRPMNNERSEWDEMPDYLAKTSWKALGVERGLEDVDTMRQLDSGGAAGMSSLDHRWAKSSHTDNKASATLPQRIALQTKLTKRCPEANCRHLLIQPDTKGVRMKIKMVAMNYLPVLELGRRRRRVQLVGLNEEPTSLSTEEIERRRRERRRTRGPAVKEEDETMDTPLRIGEIYTFQLALTNPLYDPIQIRLTQPHKPKDAPASNHHLYLPTQHFTINALKDAWAYDDEDEDDGAHFRLESEAGASEEGTVTTATGTNTHTSTFGRKRLSVLAGGSARDKRNRESGVEKRGNTSMVALEVEILPNAVSGEEVEFDLEVRYTYRAEDILPSSVADGGGSKREEYKTFTFWVRVNVGKVS